ncbi:hypothetical protein CR513_00530, partial [Mucuna pruriens]
MEGNPTQPRFPMGRVRIKKNRSSLEGTKVPRRGVHPLKATAMRSNIKFFKCMGKGHIVSQCPNKHTMILRDDDDIESESSHEETSTSSREGYNSDEVLFEGDLLMVRRLMSTFIEDDQS